jgi:hypothetical protein
MEFFVERSLGQVLPRTSASHCLYNSTKTKYSFLMNSIINSLLHYQRYVIRETRASLSNTFENAF